MDLKVKILNKEVETYYKTYVPAHETDSGIDLIIPENIFVLPNNLVTSVGLGIACEPVTHDQKPHGYYLYHRSSVSKFPIRLANHYGVIDYTYRGEIIAKIVNTSSTGFLLEKGTKLFQICSYDLSPIRTSVVSTLSETSRGAGGFGSTGTIVQLEEKKN